MGAKSCVACRQEVPGIALVCPGCGRTIAERAARLDDSLALESAAPAIEAATLPASGPPPGVIASPRMPVARRDLLLVALAVAGSAVFTFTMLTARSEPASGAAAAEPAATRPPPSSRDETPPAVARTWSAANRANWVGDRRNAVAYDVEADNTIGVWMRTVRPALVVRCMGGSTEVFVFTESAAKIEPQTEDHTVTFSFDDGAEVTERWPDSADHDALFAPDGASFARRLTRARTMRFGFTPHNAPAARMAFQVAGLDQALASAARECGWKP